MTVGAYRPLEDAARIALTELVHWIHQDYGLSEMDAYELLSKVAKIHLNEMVDPNYVVVASVEKKYLPKKRVRREFDWPGIRTDAHSESTELICENP